MAMSQGQSWISSSNRRNPENARRLAVANRMFDKQGCASASLTISDSMSTDIGVFSWTGPASDLLRPSAVACTKGECIGDCTPAKLCTQFSALMHPPQLIWIPTSLPGAGGIELVHREHC